MLLYTPLLGYHIISNDIRRRPSFLPTFFMDQLPLPYARYTAQADPSFPPSELLSEFTVYMNCSQLWTSLDFFDPDSSDISLLFSYLVFTAFSSRTRYIHELYILLHVFKSLFDVLLLLLSLCLRTEHMPLRRYSLNLFQLLLLSVCRQQHRCYVHIYTHTITTPTSRARRPSRKIQHSSPSTSII